MIKVHSLFSNISLLQDKKHSYYNYRKITTLKYVHIGKTLL